MLAWAPRPPGTLPCYTWGGKYRDCADVKIARRAAKLCRQPHNTILVGDEFLSQFRDLAEKAVYISDGTMDVTGSIDLYVQRLARQIAPVRLSGVCGGEILRRLVMFKPDPAQEGLFNPELASSFRDAAETYASELQGHRLSFTSFKQAPWYMASKFTMERSQVTYRTPYFDNDLVALAYQTPANAITAMSQRFGLLLMAIQRWERLRQIVVSPLDQFPVSIGRCIGTKSSPLKRSMPMITGCRNGWQESITCLPRCAWKNCSLGGTKSLTSVSGTAMSFSPLKGDIT